MSAVPRLRLEPLRPAHADEMFAVLGDPAIYRHLDYGPPGSAAQLHALYTRLQAGGSPDGREVWLNWLVRRFEGQQAIGYVQATVLPGRHAWVAYVIDPRHWGRGLASEAVQLMLEKLARDHPVPRLLAVIEVANHRSAALLQRLGFEAVEADPVAGDITATERLYQRHVDLAPPPRPGTAMPDDRRRFARIGFEAPAWIERPGLTPQAVTVVDLSFKGALVDPGSTAEMAPGTACELVVSLGQDGDQIRMETEVRHLEGRLLGLACTGLDLDSMTHLRRLIALNLGDPALLERDLKALIAG